MEPTAPLLVADDFHKAVVLTFARLHSYMHAQMARSSRAAEI
jgi:hypothetical protein